MQHHEPGHDPIRQLVNDIGVWTWAGYVGGACGMICAAASGFRYALMGLLMFVIFLSSAKRIADVLAMFYTGKDWWNCPAAWTLELTLAVFCTPFVLILTLADIF